MDSRERMNKALSFEESEIPIDFGANSVTGIHCSIIEKLRDRYGLEKRIVKVVEPYQMLGAVEDDLKEAMGVDTDCIWSNENMFATHQNNWKQWRTGWGQEVLISGDLIIDKMADGDYYTYAGGDTSYPPSGHMPSNGFFFDATKRQKKFNEDDLDWRDNTEEYRPISDAELAHYSEAKERIDQGRWIVGNFGGTAIGDISMVPATGLKTPKGIRDIEEWYVSTLTRQEDLHRIFAYQSEVAVENLKKIAAILGDAVDTVYICGTDFGTQNAPLCSPDLYRSLFMPYHKKINDWIHANTKWSTFKHSCGAVELFMESFIEAGFDILNPVQWTAAGMDRELIKAKYHERLVFWGGGVDTQRTLPFGSPEDVAKEVAETCEILGKGGGFVFNAIHNIQAMVPVENIVAMIEAVRKYNKA